MENQSIFDRSRTDRRGLINTDRLLSGMATQSLDAVVAVSLTNVTYTGGVFLNDPTALTFVVTSAEGDQGVVVNEADAYFLRTYSWIDEVRPFRFAATTVDTNRAAVDMLVGMLLDMGLGNATVGIEKAYLSTLYWEELVNKAASARFVDGGDVFEYARLIKTPAEIELLRRAAYYTDKAIHTAFALARPGDTEKAVTNQMQAGVLRLGADGLAHAHIHAGVHSTIVHAWPMEKPFEHGEVIHVDFGAVFGGYTTDIARNAIVGRATRRQEAIYKELWDIEQLLVDHMQPGAVAGELFDMGQAAFEHAGLIYPWGTLGHSLGLSGHEGFEIAAGSDEVLESGMVVNVEPSHIEAGDARYHVEDTVLITDDGPEILSNFTPTATMFVIS